ncbi:MAG: hypothetical protein JHD16_01660 [Solirubrobacteraceae bacterium]|nr:hypothetical protein [Solirubrobacteraceae bacterium]
MGPIVATPARQGASHPDRVRQLATLLVIAVAVSAVHYADGVINFAQYPKSGTLPNPSAAVIGLAWIAFTAIAVAAFLRYRRTPDSTALLLIAFYSGSGLIGLLHYAVPGALEMPLWRHAHIAADVACGVAIFAFALREARAR